MAYVAPNGTIQLFRNIHLTPAYTDTLWFPTLSTQTTFFSNAANYTFSNQMYTRVSGNKCRIHIVADEIRDCSYMRFQNVRGTKSKWFYAFITNVEYVNEQVTEITYEIDEVQTWCFEASDSDRFAECFIERQHAETDYLGENLVPEPLKVTENIVCSKPAFDYSSATYYLVCLGISSVNEVMTGWNSYYYGGLMSTVHYIIFKSATELDKFINNTNFSNGLVGSLFGTQDQWCIIAIYAVPNAFFNPPDANARTIKTATCYKMTTTAYEKTYTVTKPSVANHSTHGNSFDGTYTPKNNKMFSYPFSFLRVSSPISEIDLKYELFFNQSSITFNAKTCCNPDPAIIVSPNQYNGAENDYRYSLLVDGFPTLTIYQSTQTGEIIGRALKLAATTVSNAMASSAVEAGAEEISQSGLVGGSNSAPLLASAPPTLKLGNATSFAPQFAQGSNPSPAIYFSLDIYNMGLKKEFAEMFDTYLSRYGYAQNKVAKPNVHARMWWTYVKTRDCRCTVNAPASSLQKINDVMNNGITWWDYRVGVGEYGDFTNPTI